VGRLPFALRFRDTAALQLGGTWGEAVNSNLSVSQQGLLVIPIGFSETRTRAVWDTGASITAIDRRFVKAHPDKFKRLSREIKGVDAGGQKIPLELFEAKEINVGRRSFKNVPVVVLDLALLSETVAPDVYAVLGFNVIRRSDWYFDRVKRTWAIR